MLLLRNGVTGFSNSEKDTPPSVDGQRFEQLCRKVAKLIGGKVSSFRKPFAHYPSNFYEAKLGNKNIYILLNGHYPFVAFASFIQYTEIKFIDEPQLYKAFNSFNYRVLTTNELNKPIRLVEKDGMLVVENQNNLNEGEMLQMEDWKPKTYGEIIFNFWD
ncbi:hypothetical protein [Priestia abyssalis]|uniref:hypothetical protein n=1 Tax=Priestia abyssalis TaxID=1221450 RepID=UPI000995CC2A|nr:hypothetical protein [Priestia abyssalis]